MKTMRGRLLALGLVVLALAIAGFGFYRSQERRAQREAMANLGNVARAKVNQIVQWRDVRITDAALLMEDTATVATIERWIAFAQQRDTGEKRILEKFRLLQNYCHYHDVLLVDPDGQVLLSLSGRSGLAREDVAAGLAQAFATRRPAMTDLHLQSDSAAPVAEIAAPLYATVDGTNAPIGAVLLQINARQFLYPVIESWLPSTRSAETLLVRREGDQVLHLSPLRFYAGAVFKLRVPLERDDRPEAKAALGLEGVAEGVDYRGERVLAAFHPVPNSSWSIVAKMDKSEALEAWRIRAGLTIAGLLSLVAALAAAAGLIWQQQNKYQALARLTESLRQSEQRVREHTVELSRANASLQQEIEDRRRAEEALAHEHELLRTLIDLLPDGIYVKDRESRFLLANQPLAERFGKQDPAQLLGSSDRDFFPPATAAVFRADEEHVLRGASVLEKEEQVLFPNGETHTLLTSKVPLRDRQGNIIGVAGTGHDITEYKQAAERLRESEERFRKLFEDSAEPMMLIEDERFIDGNRAALSLFGMVSVDQLRGQTPAQISPEFQPDGQRSDAKARALVAQTFEEGSHFFEWEHLRAGGESFTAEVLLTAIQYRDRKILHAVCRDITRQKEAEALRTQLSAVVESTSDFVGTSSPDGKVLYINRTGRRMFGLKEHDDLAKITIEGSHPGWAAKLVLEQGIPTAIREGTWTGETAFLDHEGREIPHTQVIIAHRAADGSVELVSTVARDISEQKKTGDLVKARLRLMEAAQSSTLDEFLQTALDEIEARTGSTIGFYHFMDADQENLSLQAWSTNTTRNMCTAEGKGRHYPVSQAGVWCDCVRTRQPVIHNDYASLPHRQGLPPGHAPIVRQAVVPILRKDRIVAIIGVGNKPFAYGHPDIEVVSVLGDFSWEIVERKRAEQTLQAEQTLFHTLMENAPDRVYFKDLEGRFLRVNRSKLLRHGLTDMSQIVGKTDFDLDLGEEARLSRLDEDEIIRTGQPLLNREERILNPDGSVNWISTNKAPLRDAAGRITGIFGISRDITARKHVEEQLRDTAHRLQMLWQSVENSPVSVVITDTDGRIQYVNPKFTEVTGYSREEALGQNPRILKSGQMPPEGYQDLWRTIAAGQNWRGQFCNRRKDGSLYWESAIISPVKDEHGKIVNHLALKEDITERMEAEEASRQSLSLLQATLESTADGILVVSRGAKITSYNQRFAEIWKIPPPLLAGDADAPVLEHVAQQMADPEAFVARVAELYADLSRDSFDVLTLKDGRIVDRYSRPQLLEGQPVGRVWSFRDVTAQRRAEARQRKLLDDLERSNQELEQFAYVASHDLQEPLRLVSAYTELLLQRYRDRLDSGADPLVNFITEGVNRMQRLIQDLLAYSRVSSRRGPPKRIPSQQALDGAQANLALLILEAGAAITQDPLPEVLGDETQLVQLFQNLLGNALKFRRPEEPPRIHVGARKSDDGAAWVFSVRDNGIGIEPEFFQRIFVIFQRLHSRRKYSGTGIGLAICKRIVEHHGGQIWIESEKGLGTTFFFTIPVNGDTHD